MLPSQVPRLHGTFPPPPRFGLARKTIYLLLAALLCALWINTEIEARPRRLEELTHSEGRLHFFWIPRASKSAAHWIGYVVTSSGAAVPLDCRALCFWPGYGREAAAHPYEGKSASILWFKRKHPLYRIEVDDLYEMQVDGKEIIAYDPAYPKVGAAAWVPRGVAAFLLCLLLYRALRRELPASAAYLTD